MRHTDEDVRYGMAWKEARWAETFGATVGCPGDHEELIYCPDLPNYRNCRFCGAAL